ncbi:MAG: response regulator transcription factor [Anaerolineae bacterium]|jgi:DNA-binding response OmpR family regulator
MNAQRILVAEGRARTANQLRRCLQEAGYEVATAASGAAVLQMIARDAPDLVLVDQALPDMHGWDLVRSLREDRRLNEVGIIVLGAGRDEVIPVVSLELGADDFVPRPFSDRELLARVRAVLRRCAPARRPAATERRMSV